MHAYLCTYTAFTGAQFSAVAYASSIAEMEAEAREYMTLGDTLTIEALT